MSQSTVHRRIAASTVGGCPSHTVFARSRATPAAGPAPAAGDRPRARPVTLPPLSDTVARAAALASDPNACLIDFAELMRGDPALTALLLKRANSAAVGAATTSVRQAVTVLGLQACSQLVASVGLRTLLGHAPPAVAGRCEAVLRHSLLVAHLANQLNRAVGLGFRGEEFVAGLLHDVGRVLLTLSRPDEVPAADPLDYDEPPERVARERAVLGTDHAAVGAEFAAASKLSPPVVRAILKHHSPHAASGEHRPLVALVAVADHLANHTQRTRRVADYDPSAGRGYGVLSEAWTADRHDRFATAVPMAVFAALRNTRSTLRHVPD